MFSYYRSLFCKREALDLNDSLCCAFFQLSVNNVHNSVTEGTSDEQIKHVICKQLYVILLTVAQSGAILKDVFEYECLGPTDLP